MNDDRPTFGSLFAGIGGIDLGLERAGWECRFQVEWDPFCQRVLAKHWPDVPRYGDIAAVDWAGVPAVDLLAGGFPCQPFSYAGRRGGMDDDRWLWPEFERAIRALQPRYVLVENVPGLLVGGGMDAVLGGLAELGYDTEWESIPAAAVGAPHLRYRVWIIARRGNAASHVADPDDQGLQGRVGIALDDGTPQEPAWSRGSPLADASGERQPRSREPEFGSDSASSGQREAALFVPSGVGDNWRVEPDVGRVAHGVPARVDRLRSLGNAVVPQVVEMIGRQLLAHPQQSIEGSVTP